MSVPIQDSNESTLSRRGADLASGRNKRDLVSAILGGIWDPVTNPDVILNIGTAENYLALEDVADFVKSKDLQLDGPAFDYGEGPWGSSRLRNGMAKFMNRYFKPHTPVKPDQLQGSNGCTGMFHMLGTVIGDPGDGILLTKPCYVALSHDFNLSAKMEPVFVPFGETDQFCPEAIECYEKALQKAEKEGIKIRALVLCNPHNPLGRCYHEDTIIELMKFCKKHKIHMIADEIYAMSVYEVPGVEAVPFTSVLSLDYSQYMDPNYLHHVYGMSKDFACGGLRVALLYTKNTELSRAISAITDFSHTGQMDERVASVILEDEDWLDGFLDTGRMRLATNNRLTKALLDDAGIKYNSGANAGFFLWVDLSPWLDRFEGKDEWEREDKMLKAMLGNKLFLTGGRGQSAERAGFFRLVFSRSEATLREGIKRLVKTLEG
ncbi:PLP-dependent transferase [Polyplosphaeria fusca]|uniref:PLP-dependent transferase n=1 Tax=Polyplosphaeria fusca TaxID=682080 RepID=A0A9P4UYR0_9PLEO|nr:PLP-dependent transferase [Polyplosphaeria fusca]